jgi:RND superfamily putative drug exporter
MFVLLFGLSMDYHVFILSRIRELWLGGASAREAITGGISRSAGVVTSAAAIMVAVFSIFGTLGLIDFKIFGVGMAAAILIDATVVRGVLLPAGLALLGDRAWSQGSRRVQGTQRYGATASVTCSEPPRLTIGWSRTRATAESMSSARSTE